MTGMDMYLKCIVISHLTTWIQLWNFMRWVSCIHLQISRRHAMAFLGFCGVPFLVWLLGLFVFYIAFMASWHILAIFQSQTVTQPTSNLTEYWDEHRWAIQTPHKVKSPDLTKAVFWAHYVRPDLACCFHIACGCFLAFAIHWIRLSGWAWMQSDSFMKKWFLLPYGSPIVSVPKCSQRAFVRWVLCQTI